MRFIIYYTMTPPIRHYQQDGNRLSCTKYTTSKQRSSSCIQICRFWRVVWTAHAPHFKIVRWAWDKAIADTHNLAGKTSSAWPVNKIPLAVRGTIQSNYSGATRLGLTKKSTLPHVSQARALTRIIICRMYLWAILFGFSVIGSPNLLSCSDQYWLRCSIIKL